MTILVTGGAGFIGSHLCEYLLNKGDDVVCIDNFFTGRKENVAHLLSNPKFEIIRHDITQPLSIHCDQIYNLACPASPVHYQFNPIETTKANTVGVVNMLELANKCQARILQTSTSEVYGDPTVHPQPESYAGSVNCIGPRACYDEGKRVAESMMMDYNRQYSTDIKIVRIFNTYGPRMVENDGRVVSNFIVQALRDEPITLYGNGDQTRSFCYISDLIEVIYLMMNKEGFQGPVNIGNPNEFTIKELADKVIALTGSKSKITYHSLPQDDPRKRQPDITLAKRKLGWEPTVQLNKGLKKTIEYFRGVI